MEAFMYLEKMKICLAYSMDYVREIEEYSTVSTQINERINE